MDRRALASVLVAGAIAAAGDGIPPTDMACPSDPYPKLTWLGGVYSGGFGFRPALGGWSFRRGHTLRPVEVRASTHTEPGHWIVGSPGAPDIHVRFKPGIYGGDVDLENCALDKLVYAIASQPAILARSLPSRTNVLVQDTGGIAYVFTRSGNILGDYGWTADSWQNAGRAPEYYVSLDAETLTHDCEPTDRDFWTDWRPHNDYWWPPILTHEFAHVIDMRFSVTTMTACDHCPWYGGWWQAIHETNRPHGKASFVTLYAERNASENFAETFAVWLAYRSERMDALLPYTLRAHDANVQSRHRVLDVDATVKAKMCRELAWWDYHGLRAATSNDGSLWLGPSGWTDEDDENNTVHVLPRTQTFVDSWGH